MALQHGRSAIGFNPRPYVRGDMHLVLQQLLVNQFQSAPLREGRFKVHVVPSPSVCFNPRPYVRGDGWFANGLI